VHGIELRLEVEVIKPDSSSQITTLLHQAINESISSSRLRKIVPPEKIHIMSEQHLPSLEELKSAIVTLRLGIQLYPHIISHLKSFLEILRANGKFKKATPARLSLKLSFGNKTIEAKNLELDDAFKAIVNGIEVGIRPHRKD